MKVDKYSENIILTSEKFAMEREFWQQKLHGEINMSGFPKDNRSGNIPYYAKAEVSFQFPGDISSKMLTMCKNSDYALYIILLAGVKALLARYTGSTDLILGGPVFKQANAGEYLNEMLIFRTELTDTETFKDFLSKVKTTVSEADKHQNFPYELAFALVNFQRVREGEGNFKTVVLLENIQEKERVQGLEPDMLFIFNREGEGLHGCLEYNAHLYESATVNRVCQHLCNFLGAVLENPGAQLAEIEFLTPEEIAQLVYEFNDTAADYPRTKTIHQLFSEQVQRTPDNIAVTCENQSLTYAGLNSKANQLARFLQEQGVGSETIVAVMVERSVLLIIAALGVLKAGGGYLSVDPTYPEERIRYMLVDSGARVLLTQRQIQSRAVFAGKVIDLTDEQVYSGDSSDLPVQSTPANLAYIIYTSGTTGQSKGVMIEHHNVVRLFFTSRPLFEFTGEDVWTMFHSFCFDFSVWEMYGALLTGGRLVVVPELVAKEPAAFLRLLNEEKVTILNQTPTAFSNLLLLELMTGERALRIRYVIFGGEALKPIILQDFLTKYPECKLINMYGITETTVHVTYKEITALDITANISNIGGPIPTLTAYIMDKNLKLLPIGAVGELCVGGEGVGRGYLNRPEMTAEKFVLNPYREGERLYRSGDYARRLSNGVEYVGRIDQQVKIRGYRIEIGEIETNLIKHQSIKEAVVVPLESAEGHKYLAAYFVADELLTVGELREYLSGYLPDYMIPAYFVQLTSLPLTPNGKIDRKALPDPGQSAITLDEYIAPQTKEEIELAQIWAEVLGRERVGLTDNFFDLGGDSIKAIALISKINAGFKISLEMKDLYQQQTIQELLLCVKLSSSEVADNLQTGLRMIEEIKAQILADAEAKAHLPTDVEDFYPLSPIQQGMVFFSKLKPDEPIYHDQFVYKMQFQDFQPQLFGRAISLLVEKHPILRTTFDILHFKVAMQIVRHNTESHLQIEDLSNFSSAEQEIVLRGYLQDDLRRKFSFTGELLWRLSIYKVEAKVYYLILSFHHAILDGWSVASLGNELLEIYLTLEKAQAYTVETLKSSYKDYIALNLSRRISPETTLFWQKSLEGYSRLKLPFNISSKKQNNLAASKIYRYKAGVELLQKLELRARDYGCTLKEICLSAYLYLLKVTTTENDLVTGVVTHDRPVLIDSEKILGCFLNTIPLRIFVPDEVEKLKLVQMVKDYLIKVKAHELFLADIANLVGEVNNSGNPIFDTIFNYTDFHVLDNELTTEVVNKVEGNIELQPSEMTNTLFDFEVSKTLHNFNIQIKYSPNYFNEANIASALNLYLRILEKYADDQVVSLRTAELITLEVRQKILYDFNNTAQPYPKEKTLHQLCEEQVEKNPHHVALVLGEEKMTYAELNSRANQLARYLGIHGVKSGDFVGIISERNFEMIIGMLAILKIGGAYVPIDPKYPAARKEYLMQNSGVSAVLVDDAYELNCLNTLNIAADLQQYSGENLNLKKDSTDLAYVIYTSGSTGQPKGVMIEHHSAVNLVQWVNAKFNVGENDALLFITSMCFDLSVYDIFGTLAAGGRLVIAQKSEVQNPHELKRLISKEQITFWDSVPSTMNHLINVLLAEDANYRSLSLRLVFLSGDWIPVKLPDEIRKFFPHAQVISLGGATEGTVWSIYYPVEKVEEYQSSIPYGKPITNNYFYILDKNLQIVPEGVAGELYIGGVGVARGYMNNPEKTQASFMPNPFLPQAEERMYKTGDLGRMMPDGNIEFLGRLDYQVKIRGYRVELGEIENQLLKHPAIKEAVVVAREDASGKYLVAYVVSDTELTVQEQRQYLAQELPDYMVPTYFVHLPRIPLTSNGKIDRQALPAPESNIKTGVEYLAPDNLTEEKLVKIWQEVLGVERISVKDDFFELGGHSLKATTLVAKIHREFAVEVPLKEIFRISTVRELAVYLEGAAQKQYAAIPPVEKSAYYPLSSAQERLYILHQFAQEATNYNMPGAVLIEGRLVERRLGEVFALLVKRHETLRTSFTLLGDKPVQRVHEELGLTIDIEEVAAEEVSEMITQFIKPFHLEQAPLMRVKLLKLAEDRHILLFDLHHIISDGTSLQNMIKEFVALYTGNTLPELPIQYKDYAIWQRNLAGSEKMRQAENYWLERFAGEIPLLTIPTDFPRPAVQSFTGGKVQALLDKRLTKALKELGSETGTTLYMLLLGFYTILLSKYSGAEDIIIGSPVAGRPHPDVEQLMGMFVNTLAMRNYPAGEKTFREFLAEVKDNALQAYEHQDYQFEELVEKLNLRRDVSRNPLFDTLFVLQNMEQQEIHIPGLKFSPYEFANNVTKFDLTLTATEKEAEVQLVFTYASKLFKEDTVARLARHFLHIIQNVLSDQEQRIAEIEMLTQAEREQILWQFNPAKKSRESATIPELFVKQVKRSENQVALVYGKEQLTYGELFQQSAKIAAILQSRGVGPDEIVAIMVERSLEMITGIMGILLAGGAYLPIAPDYPKERIRYMLQDSGARFCLVGANEKLDFAGEVINLKGAEIASIQSTEDCSKCQSGHLAYVLYTSGTTGKPKGVMIEQGNLVNLVDALQEVIYGQYERNLNVALVAPYVFDASVKQIFPALLLGHVLHLVPEDVRMSGEGLSGFYRGNAIDVTDGTPIHLRLLLNALAPGEQGLAVKHLVIGGEALPLSVLEEIAAWDEEFRPAITNVYGPTECCDVTTAYPVKYADLPKYNTVPIGKPLCNTRVYILGNDFRLKAIGTVGELCIAGAGVGRGYLHLGELTQQKFASDPFVSGDRMYQTGDLARWLPDGQIEFLGRQDQQVKIRGFRIEIGEIESELLKHPDIKEAAVIAREDGEGEKYLAAYFTAVRELAILELREFLAEEIPAYLIPARFKQLLELPLTRNGKIDRALLPEIVTEPEVNRQTAAPESAVQQKLLAIFAEVLRVKNIGIDDNFFMLGGHSLKAAIMVAKVHQELNVALPLSEIFKHGTVRELAQYIETAEKSLYAAIEPAIMQEHYPLSSAQKRLFILNKLKNDLSYNLPFALKVEGELDVDRFKQTCREIIFRHEVFRTSFALIEGKPVQQIMEEVEFQIACTEAKQTEVDTLIRQFIQPFDLHKAPLLKVGLLQLSDKQWIMLFDMHHIVSDGVSIGVIVQEFVDLYAGQRLPAPRIHYKDFAIWQNNLLHSDVMQKQETFWLNKFTGEIPVLNLPADYTRPALKSYAGDRVAFRVGRELNSSLNKLAQRTGTTLYLVLFAAYNLLLARYSGDTDIVVGTPVAGRPHADVEKVPGMFVNTLPIRNSISFTETFGDFLTSVKETVLQAFENQDYQFEALVEKLALERDLSRNPLFDVMFVLQNMEINELAIKGLKFTPYEFAHQAAKFDLTLYARERADGLHFTLEYSTKLFNRETVERIAAHFANILQAVVKNPGLSLGEIDLLSPEERAQILYSFNATEAEYPQDMTIHELLKMQAERNPETTSVSFEGEKLTCGELYARSSRLAQLLRAKGVGLEQIVGIMLPRSLAMPVGLFGILQAGGAYLPINPDYPEERVKFMLADSGAKILLTSRAVKATVNPAIFSGEIIDIEDDGLFMREVDDVSSRATSSNLAYVIYTSGSTGKPKGVMIEHGAVINRLHWMQKQYPLTETDVILQKTPFTFDVSVWELFWFIFQGAQVCFLKPGGEKDPAAIIEAVEKNQVTTIHFVPSMLGTFLHWLESSGSVPSLVSLRQVFASGEALTPQHVSSFYHLFSTSSTRLINLYGPTEAAVDVTYYTCPAEELEVVPIGRPIDNINLYIVGKANDLQPVGVPGELCISGVGLARGYLHRRELTAEKFVPNPFGGGTLMYRTGDLAKWLTDGSIAYLGRMDNQVKIRGFRIETGEIEIELLRHPLIKAVIVTIWGVKEGNQMLVAYYVAKEPVSPETLRNHLGKTLPEFMIPQYFIELTDLPLLANGKIDRKALPGVEKGLAPTSEYQAPENELEEKLVHLWSKLLNLDPARIGINDNFFELGGNSLLLIQMHGEVEKYFPGVLSVTELFTVPTVRKLADFLVHGKVQNAKIELQTVNLPADFYQAGEKEPGAAFNFQIDQEFYGRLVEAAETSGFAVMEILLALYLYLFTEIAGESKVAVQTMVEKPAEVVEVCIDTAAMASMDDLLALVRTDGANSSGGRKSYQIRQLTRYVEDNYAILPFFYQDSLLTERVQLTELYDIILAVSPGGNEIRFQLEYNHTRLRAEKMREFVKWYLGLVEAFLDMLSEG